MIDISETIEEIECSTLGEDNPQCIKDAIKVLKMWQAFVKDYGGYVIDFQYKAKQVREFTDEIEEKFFPSIITQTLMVKTQGKDMHRIEAIMDTIECIKGVKEVMMHDKDC